MVGASFTGLTTRLKLSLAVPPLPSLAVATTVIVPWKLAGGVKLNGAFGSTVMVCVLLSG